jgi:hypothetical protein
MKTQELVKGLWRWTAPHPGWTEERGGPGGWERMVGCVYFEAPDALVLIDPLAPPDGTEDAERFWKALDDDVRRAGVPVAVLVGNDHHSRDAGAVYRRYRDGVGATLHAPEQTGRCLKCSPTHRFGDGAALPGGVTAHAIQGLDAGETAFFLPGPRALVFADAVLGAAEGKVAVAPVSWAPDSRAGREAYAAGLRTSVRRLVKLEPSLLLTSHGDPVLDDGRRALAAAADAPAWGS